MIRTHLIKTLESRIERNVILANSKININIPIEGAAKQEVLDLNYILSKKKENQISFGLNNLQMPHITILIGYLSPTKTNYRIFEEKLRNFCLKLKVFDVELGNIYKKHPDSNYVFLEIENSDKILELRSKLYGVMQNEIELVKWDILNEPAHITLGYFEKPLDNIDDIFLRKINNKNYPSRRMNLSLPGKYGTCLVNIGEYLFKTN